MRDEGVLRRLTAALRESRDPDVGAIVVRARHAAVAEATSVLEAAFTQSILERAADLVESTQSGSDAPSPHGAPGQDTSWVWYVYAIQRADAALPGGLDGVVGATVEGVEAGGLRAIVSRVAAGELGERALGEKLENLRWVAENARAHEAVLTVALEAGPILPLSFGTVFDDRQAVVDVLLRHGDALHAEVDRIAGYSEWGAKALVDVAACDSWIGQHALGVVGASGERTASEGRTYLARKHADRGLREVRRGLLLDLATEFHEHLSALALEATSEPAQQAELSGYEGEMILNGAYLLDEASVAPFHDAASELAERHATKGITLETTGPWPPHHFISLPPIERDVGGQG
jgi:Gas vesicle synthesis protein GvpL/GvpF